MPYLNLYKSPLYNEHIINAKENGFGAMHLRVDKN